MAIRALIVALIVGISGAYAHQLGRSRAIQSEIPRLESLPSTLDGWYSQDHPLSKQAARVLAADATLQRRYRRRDGSEIWLFVAYFAEQAVNSQIHSPRQCVPGNGWAIMSIEHQTVPLSRGPQLVTRMLLDRNGNKQEMIYWFRTRGGVLTGEYAMKWDLLQNALARRPTDAVFVRYTAPIEDAAALREMMLKLDGPLNDILGKVGLP